MAGEMLTKGAKVRPKFPAPSHQNVGTPKDFCAWGLADPLLLSHATSTRFHPSPSIDCADDRTHNGWASSQRSPRGFESRSRFTTCLPCHSLALPPLTLPSTKSVTTDLQPLSCYVCFYDVRMATNHQYVFCNIPKLIGGPLTI